MSWMIDEKLRRMLRREPSSGFGALDNLAGCRGGRSLWIHSLCGEWWYFNPGPWGEGSRVYSRVVRRYLPATPTRGTIRFAVLFRYLTVTVNRLKWIRTSALDIHICLLLLCSSRGEIGTFRKEAGHDSHRAHDPGQRGQANTPLMDQTGWLAVFSWNMVAGHGR